MTIEIGNAPWSRGCGRRGRSAQSAVLRDCAAAHCRGIELGPVGDMSETALDPAANLYPRAEDGLRFMTVVHAAAYSGRADGVWTEARPPMLR